MNADGTDADVIRLSMTITVTDAAAVPTVLACMADEPVVIESLQSASGDDVVSVNVGVLTDRQLETLRYAYRTGYYDTPRTTDLGELAGTFDVSRSAISQRLNVAETKLVGAIVDALEPTAPD